MRETKGEETRATERNWEPFDANRGKSEANRVERRHISTSAAPMTDSWNTFASIRSPLPWSPLL